MNGPRNDANTRPAHTKTCPRGHGRTTNHDPVPKCMHGARTNVYPATDNHDDELILNDSRANVRPPAKHVDTAPPAGPRERTTTLVNDARLNVYPPPGDTPQR